MKELTEQFWVVKHKIAEVFINTDGSYEDECLYETSFPETKWDLRSANDVLSNLSLPGNYTYNIQDKDKANYEVIEVTATYKVK